MTWAKIIAGLVSFINWLASQITEAKAKEAERLRDETETDRILDIARDADPNSVPDDDIIRGK